MFPAALCCAHLIFTAELFVKSYEVLKMSHMGLKLAMGLKLIFFSFCVNKNMSVVFLRIYVLKLFF